MNLPFNHESPPLPNQNLARRFGSIEMPKPSAFAYVPYFPKYMQPVSKQNLPKTRSCNNLHAFPPLASFKKSINFKDQNVQTKQNHTKFFPQNDESKIIFRSVSPTSAKKLVLNAPSFKSPAKSQQISRPKSGNYQLQPEQHTFQPRLSYNLKICSPRLNLNLKQKSNPTSDSGSQYLSQDKMGKLQKSFDCKSVYSNREKRKSLMASKQKQKGHSLLNLNKAAQIPKVPAFIRDKKQAKSRKSSVQKVQIQNNSQTLLSYAEINQCFNQVQAEFEIKINIKPALKKRSLSDFDLIKQLGKGSFGKAFLAIQKSINFACVLKVIDKEKLTSIQIDNLVREAKIQCYLSHAHLTRFYGFFDDQTSFYLILELLPSGDLRSKMKKRGMPEAKVAAIIKQICQGISHMHRFDLIHRDIKPQNIFTFQNYVKLGDFGCAVYCPDRRLSFVGSPCYLSPEQLRNQHYDDKVDVWEIGTLTYQLLFSVCPFQKDILAMIQGSNKTKQLSELKFPPKIPVSESTIDFLKKCLNKDAEARMSLEQALQHTFLKNVPEKRDTLHE